MRRAIKILFSISALVGAGTIGYAIGNCCKCKDSKLDLTDDDLDDFDDIDCCGCTCYDAYKSNAERELKRELEREGEAIAPQQDVASELANSVSDLLTAVDGMVDAVKDACPKKSEAQKALHEKTAKVKKAVEAVKETLGVTPKESTETAEEADNEQEQSAADGEAK